MTPELADLWTRTNPWHQDAGRFARMARNSLPAKWIPRQAAEALSVALRTHRGVVQVVGPKRAGRRSLVWAGLAAAKRPVLILRGRDLLTQAWARAPGPAAQDIATWLPQDGVVVVEDVESLPGAGPLLQGLVDRGPHRTVVVSGTEAPLPHALRVPLWPLDLDEVAPPLAGEPETLRDQRRRRAVDGMLLFGGYPDAWTGQSPVEILGELVETTVLREITDRHRIAHPTALRRLLQLAAGQLGRVVNYSEWARILGISAPTVVDYLALLQASHVLCLPRPFSGGRRAELVRAPRVYFVDNGLRNAVRGGFTPLEQRSDLDALLENHVFSALLKHSDDPDAVRCWRTRNGAEVDFVLEPQPDRLIGVEVKATAEARPRLPRAARSFIRAYAPEQLWMVTRGQGWEDSLGKTRLRGVPVETLPQALDGL